MIRRPTLDATPGDASATMSLLWQNLSVKTLIWPSLNRANSVDSQNVILRKNLILNQIHLPSECNLKKIEFRLKSMIAQSSIATGRLSGGDCQMAESRAVEFIKK